MKSKDTKSKDTKATAVKKTDPKTKSSRKSAGLHGGQLPTKKLTVKMPGPNPAVEGDLNKTHATDVNKTAPKMKATSIACHPEGIEHIRRCFRCDIREWGHRAYPSGKEFSQINEKNNQINIRYVMYRDLTNVSLLSFFCLPVVLGMSSYAL